ncbi:MAG: glycoside hydrolase family 15 protein [Sedimentisphaerales bacterium]|nr:glycoside hydrolase family 15 protein [Sedimentisphaerales bacterium]
MDTQQRHYYRLGIVGNCSYIAYIDDQAAVQWMCMPRFDSSFLFGSLLDADSGGEFSIRSPHECSTQQRYVENTNILLTDFRATDGSFRVTDFAPRFYQYDRYFRPMMLVRKIEPIRGQPRIIVRCAPVGDYGRAEPEVVVGSNHIRYLNLDGHVRLTTDIPLCYVADAKPFVLNEPRYLLFSYGPPLEAPLAVTAEEFLEKTRKYWLQWVKTMSITPIFQEAMIRSALVLKLHQYEDTGGIVASGTTSLPESPQSGRTWDYRYCWLRDTYYVLKAFNDVGHFEELEKYFHFVQNLMLREAPAVHPVYTATGDPVPTEQRLALAGYRGNQPVRIGNNAVGQRQHDMYGQVLISLLPLYIDKRLRHYDTRHTLDLVRELLDRVDSGFEEPDAGIWEFRGRLQHHCHTYLFHWAGSHAAVKIAESLGDTALRDKAADLVQRSAAKIEACYDPAQAAYTQAIGVKHLDASDLQLISLHYLDPASERARQHLTTLESQLQADHGLFYRYVHEDDFGKPQSAFLAAAFWFVESLACVGRISEAIDALERLLPYSNHLGLFSEDVTLDGSQWGNFPQTYSHVGLMNAVYRIARRLDRPIFL